MTFSGEGETLPDDEWIARGILSIHVDKGIVTEKLFKGSNASVNRLSKMPIAETVVHFKKTLPKPEQNLSYFGYASLSIQQFRAKVAEQKTANSDFNDQINVVYRPVPDNVGHSQIEPQVTKALSLRLVKAVQEWNQIYPDEPSTA